MFDRPAETPTDPFLHILAQLVRDMPDTSELSARLAFGTRSARDVLSGLARDLEAAGFGETANAYRSAAAALAHLPDTP